MVAPELLELPNVGSAKEFDLEGAATLVIASIVCITGLIGFKLGQGVSQTPCPSFDLPFGRAKTIEMG